MKNMTLVGVLLPLESQTRPFLSIAVEFESFHKLFQFVVGDIGLFCLLRARFFREYRLVLPPFGQNAFQLTNNDYGRTTF